MSCGFNGWNGWNGNGHGHFDGFRGDGIRGACIRHPFTVHFDWRRGQDGYLIPMRERCHDSRCHNSFCKPIVKRVVCINPSGDFRVPTELRVTGLFNELAANNCFDLIFCTDTLQMSSTSNVVLTDTVQEFTLLEGGTGNTVKYDQLVELVDFHHRTGWRHCPERQVVLKCFYGNDGPVGHSLHITVLGECTPCGLKHLPKTTHTPEPQFLPGPPGPNIIGEASI